VTVVGAVCTKENGDPGMPPVVGGWTDSRSKLNPFIVKAVDWDVCPFMRSLIVPVVTPSVPKIGSEGAFKVTVLLVPQPCAVV